jgi:hypothetical protein
MLWFASDAEVLIHISNVVRLFETCTVDMVPLLAAIAGDPLIKLAARVGCLS